MQNVRHLLFDLGKVLLDFNNDNAGTYLTGLGVTDFSKHYQTLIAQNLFNDFETGTVTADGFLQTISKELNDQISREQLLQAWNAIIIGFRTESMKHLETLKSDFGLYLLSNTNPLHLDEINRVAVRELNGRQLDHYFEKTFYSHLMGVRKPNQVIYKKVIEEAGIQPSQTLFVDDLPENIAAAAVLGFQTHQLLPDERIENLNFLRFGFH